jgi:hypothetical protein
VRGPRGRVIPAPAVGPDALDTGPAPLSRAGALLGRSPFVVGAAVLAIYAVWLAAWIHGGHSARENVYVGQTFISRSAASVAIRDGPVQATSPIGFDGQFYYYIATDPRRAAPYIDYPSYRYQRIGYALAARAVVLGRRDLVPEGLLVVNLVAIAGGTVALAAWLVRRGVTPWAAAVWGLHPGQLVSLRADLPDAAGYGAAIAGLWLRDHWLIPAGLIFGLAGLTRETTLVFPAFLLVADIAALRGERRTWPWLRAALAALAAFTPFAVWKLFLWHWLGHSDIPLSWNFTPVPFGGIAHELIRSLEQYPLLASVAIPALVSLVVAAWALGRRIWRAEVALVIVNVLGLVVFAHFHVFEFYPSATRVGLGAVLAAVMMLAAVPERGWFWFLAGLWLWLTPIWFMHPPFQTPSLIGPTNTAG